MPALQPRPRFSAGHVPKTQLAFRGQDPAWEVYQRRVIKDCPPSTEFLDAIATACQALPNTMDFLRRARYQIIGTRSIQEAGLHRQSNVLGLTQPNGRIYLGEFFSNPPDNGEGGKAGNAVETGQEALPPLKALDNLRASNRGLESVLAHEAGHAMHQSISKGLGMEQEISASPYFSQLIRKEIASQPQALKDLTAPGKLLATFHEFFAEIAAECQGVPTMTSARLNDESFRYVEQFPQSYCFVQGQLRAFGIKTPGWPQKPPLDLSA